jgi:HK97 family phage prohead protease
MDTLRDLDIVRAFAPATELRDDAAPSADTLGVMDVRFSVFDTWYEIESWFEGTFLERTVAGSFKKTIRERRNQIRVLYDHGFDFNIGNKVLGAIDYLEEESAGPRSEVPLFDTSYNRDLLPGLRANVYGSSFRFRVIKDEWNDEPDASKYNPKAIPERTIKEVRLFEFGPVTFPANPDATAGMRSMTDEYYANVRRSNPAEYDALVARATKFRTSHQHTAAPGTVDGGQAARTNDDDPALCGDQSAARTRYLQWKARQRAA